MTPWTSKPFYSINSSKVLPKGKVKAVDVLYANKQTVIAFIFIKHIKPNVIMGLDFIAAMDLLFFARTQKVMFAEDVLLRKAMEEHNNRKNWTNKYESKVVDLLESRNTRLEKDNQLKKISKQSMDSDTIITKVYENSSSVEDKFTQT